ncbi:hypothetical protein CASFOL_026877 [Castilleja foliolosa]|uniref:Uncharacterized protein n=1 Tax=Castilleja foliolosa TaxID=1961234 RepID=A0ABD3CIA8_9LAMI
MCNDSRGGGGYRVWVVGVTVAVRGETPGTGFAASNRSMLDALLSDESLATVPFLILGNKIDIPYAASEDELRYHLGLMGITTGKGMVNLTDSKSCIDSSLSHVGCCNYRQLICCGKVLLVIKPAKLSGEHLKGSFGGAEDPERLSLRQTYEVAYLASNKWKKASKSSKDATKQAEDRNTPRKAKVTMKHDDNIEESDGASDMDSGEEMDKNEDAAHDDVENLRGKPRSVTDSRHSPINVVALGGSSVDRTKWKRKVILQSETIRELTKTSQALSSAQIETSELCKLVDQLKIENVPPLFCLFDLFLFTIG